MCASHLAACEVGFSTGVAKHMVYSPALSELAHYVCAGASQAAVMAAILEGERPLSPPPTSPELDALGPVESAKRLTPDRESAGGFEAPTHENSACFRHCSRIDSPCAQVKLAGSLHLDDNTYQIFGSQASM